MRKNKSEELKMYFMEKEFELYAGDFNYLPWTAFSALCTFLLNSVSCENADSLCLAISNKCEKFFIDSGGFTATHKYDTQYSLAAYLCRKLGSNMGKWLGVLGRSEMTLDDAEEAFKSHEADHWRRIHPELRRVLYQVASFAGQLCL